MASLVSNMAPSAVRSLAVYVEYIVSFFLISLSTGCDNYMPYMDTILMPDGDCNFVCPGDSTELCGAANRLVLYQNSAATPPSTSNCITWRGDWYNNILEAVPKTGGGSATKLYAIPTNPFTDPIYYTIISVRPTLILLFLFAYY